MSRRVIVAGHICLDITPVFPGKSVKDITTLLRPGKLVNVKEADIHTGGCVANTGLAMKLLGADVTLMGKIGQDVFGQVISEILGKYGVTDTMIRIPGETTSYSIVLAVPGIDRMFLHNPGTNDTFCCGDIPWETVKDAALFHFGYPPLMKKVYENDGEELLSIMRTAKQYGIATSMDLAAVDVSSEAGLADWKQILKNVLPYVDFFVPSAEELCYMLDRERFEDWQRRANGDDIVRILDVREDIKPLADCCMELGTRVLLIKCGALGMYYRTAGREELSDISNRINLELSFWSEREGFEKSYIPERILSGTGAGDTSVAAFLTAMLEGENLEACMQLAAAAGASCVASYDALSGLKSLDEWKRKIADGWAKTW